MIRNGVVKSPPSSMREPAKIAPAEIAPPTAISMPVFVARSRASSTSMLKASSSGELMRNIEMRPT